MRNIFVEFFHDWKEKQQLNITSSVLTTKNIWRLLQQAQKKLVRRRRRNDWVI